MGRVMSPTGQSVKFTGQRAVAGAAQEEGLVNFCPETRYKFASLARRPLHNY